MVQPEVLGGAECLFSTYVEVKGEGEDHDLVGR